MYRVKPEPNVSTGPNISFSETSEKTKEMLEKQDSIDNDCY
jgi:hypothetical protein